MPKKPKIENEFRSGISQQIDENLRRIYASKLAEDIPDHLQDLLRQLRDKDAAP